MLSWIELDVSRLRSNIDAFRRAAGSGTSVMVVIKANAYGHGLQEIAPVAAAAGDWLGVNSLDEALAITAAGLRKPVAILGYTDLRHAATIVRNEYRQVLYRLDLAEALSREAQALGCDAKVHLKIETGTNRQGIALGELPEFVLKLKRMAGLCIEGVYTHFANIEDTLDPAFAQLQLRRFQQALDILHGAEVRPAHVHAAATAGALLYPETDFTMIRLGIGAYGVWPSRETQLAARERGRRLSLLPVLSWKTRIVQVKQVAAGDYVGYGLTYQACRTMRIAVLPIGYFDGYDRKLSNASRVLVRGRFAPVIGRVAMNMTMIDVSDAAAENDDEVVLIGTQGNSTISVEEVAGRCGTIAYELLSRLNPLLPRVVKNDSSEVAWTG